MWYAPRLPMPPRPKSQKAMSLRRLKSELFAMENPARARFQQGFFKCGPGEYAEGDVMLGINVPTQRKVASKYSDLPLSDLKKLLSSREHEFKFVALVILATKYRKADTAAKKK